jgi:hypothetical protein
MSGHAQTRSQQRGVPPGVLSLLYRFGTEVHDKRGGVVLFFDKNARKRMVRELGSQYVGRLGPLLNAYLVEQEGRIITVGHRYARLARH